MGAVQITRKSLIIPFRYEDDFIVGFTSSHRLICINKERSTGRREPLRVVRMQFFMAAIVLFNIKRMIISFGIGWIWNRVDVS